MQLGDHVSKVMGVMFSDIRSFTTLSESMTAKENFAFVNSYLSQVSPEIRNHHGLIVKFLGDGMMAVFPEGADDGLAAGVATLKAVDRFNQLRQPTAARPIQVGIGIHLGQMMLGMVGEANRMQGDAFSDTVNLTARLEGLTKFYGVSLLISGRILDHLSHPEHYQIRFLDRAIVKGRSEPIAVYEILDGECEAVRSLKLQTQPDFEQGIEYYREGDLAGARNAFENVLVTHPGDKTAQLYLERVETLRDRGLPDQWTGIWTFSEK